MTRMAEQAASAALGVLVGAGMTALTALAQVLGSKLVRSVRAGLVFGPALRMTGAAVGTVSILLLKPRSVASFVIAFLVSYLAFQAIIVLGMARRGAGR